MTPPDDHSGIIGFIATALLLAAIFWFAPRVAHAEPLTLTPGADQ